LELVDLDETRQWIYTRYVYIKEAEMKVAKWGNSLAIRLPAVVVEIMDLKEGDDIDVRVAGTGAIEVERSKGLEEMLERLRKYRGLVPKDFKFDRLEANARGRDEQE
jgi:antitoxin MazE